MKTIVNTLLASQLGRKMISNLCTGLEMEHRAGKKLTEFNFISELPTKQLDLFNIVFEACAEESKSSLCVKLIKGKTIKF